MKIITLASSLLIPLSVGASAAVPRVLHAVGAVTIESKGKVKPAKAGAALADKDAVATGPDATAVLEMQDGTRFKLRESSRLVLRLPGPGSLKTSLELSAGALFAKVMKVAAGGELKVRAGTMVAAIRGTEFFLSFGKKVEAGRSVWLCVKEGAVDVKADGRKKTLLLKGGLGVLIKPGEALPAGQPFAWTEKLNWNMDPAQGAIEDKTVPVAPAEPRP